MHRHGVELVDLIRSLKDRPVPSVCEDGHADSRARITTTPTCTVSPDSTPGPFLRRGVALFCALLLPLPPPPPLPVVVVSPRLIPCAEVPPPSLGPALGASLINHLEKQGPISLFPLMAYFRALRISSSVSSALSQTPLNLSLPSNSLATLTFDKTLSNLLQSDDSNRRFLGGNIGGRNTPARWAKR